MMWRGWDTRLWNRLCALGLLLLALPGCQSFLPNFCSQMLTLSWGSYTHQYMTEKAILNVTMETLKSLPGRHHSGTQRHVIKAGLGRVFWHAVGEVVHANSDMDFGSSTKSEPIYHFDSERVDAAMEKLREYWNQTVLLAKAKEYQGARQNLGKLFHSLQDFYSHSNWVEMGKKTIYQHLLDPKAPAIPTASEDTSTCEECHMLTCKNNILKVMLNPESPFLTTGYFSDYPIKPPGKCSHGGILDSSRHQGARGGINKDSSSPFFSPHHYLHAEAAELATMATLNVLRELRDTVGPKSFLRLFSVRQPPALVFVIDTTGSMFEEISAARWRAYSIIQAREHGNVHTLPGTFLLVPFHDPGVGPVYETDDPKQFLHYLEELTALGGGDEPEMCFTAIQLALTKSPPLSEIFVFTDASAKDQHLYNSVKVLTLEKQSKVTFLLTEDTHRKRRETLSPYRFSLYTSLASVSGGLTIFTSNKDIEKVSAIVQDSATASKVTLLHVEDHADSDCSHHFQVDRSMNNVTLHLAGVLMDCTLYSPNGQSQALLGPPGPLAELEQLQGLYRVMLRPPIQPGQWHITAKAKGNVTFSAIGDSSLDFLYYFATEANETHPGLSRVEGSPIAGLPVFLVLTVTGLSSSERASFSHVTLVGTGDEGLQNVSLNATSSSWMSELELFGRIEAVPRQSFCVHLFGRDGHGNTLERVSSELIQPTRVQIQVLSSSGLVPGHSSSVEFEVWNHGPARSFSLSAEDDHGYLLPTGPYSFHIGERSSFSRDVVLKTPRKAAAGEAVTLTLMVHARDSADSNYAVVHLTVIPQDNDTSPPSCSAMHVLMSCPEQCSLGNWSVSLAVKDRGHSGLAAVQLSQGGGTLMVLHPGIHFSGAGKGWRGRQPGDSLKEARGSESDHMVVGEPPLNLTSWVGERPVRLGYVSACCAPKAELVVWDKAGNSRRCHLVSRQQRASPVDNNTASCQPTHTCHSMGLVLPLISLLAIGAM